MSESQQMPGTPKEALRALRILFGALLAGVIMFSVIVLALNFMTEPVSPFQGFENIILGGAIALSLVCFMLARKGYNKGTGIAKDSLISLPDKLNQYRATLILYMALCEGPALFGIILFYLTGNYFMFIITAMMIAAMLAKAPARQRVVDDLGLDWQQQEQLN
jgi:hypothetical protein